MENLELLRINRMQEENEDRKIQYEVNQNIEFSNGINLWAIEKKLQNIEIADLDLKVFSKNSLRKEIYVTFIKVDPLFILKYGYKNFLGYKENKFFGEHQIELIPILVKFSFRNLRIIISNINRKDIGRLCSKFYQYFVYLFNLISVKNYNKYNCIVYSYFL